MVLSARPKLIKIEVLICKILTGSNISLHGFVLINNVLKEND